MVSETAIEKPSASTQRTKHSPCVSLLMPFNPKMTTKSDIDKVIARLAKQVESGFNTKYSSVEVAALQYRLLSVFQSLDYGSFKQSIAVFVSTGTSKLYYLDFAVEEKVIIDDSFEIRDLLYGKKDLHKYLIIVLGKERSQVFIGNTTQFLCIESITLNHAIVNQNKGDSKSTWHGDKKKLYQQFLHHVDNSLSIILPAYRMPLFVIGTAKLVDDFLSITAFSNHILSSIVVDHDAVSEQSVRSIIQPYVADWKKVKEQDLLQKLHIAKASRALAQGIDEVRTAAAKKQGLLLAVEKNLICPAADDESDGTNCFHGETKQSPLREQDLVDQIIEQVLQNGGDIEFVDEGVLYRYSFIALILSPASQAEPSTLSEKVHSSGSHAFLSSL